MQDVDGAAKPQDYGTVIAADFTRGGDLAYRLGEEIRSLAAAGQSVGLLQHCAPSPRASVAPEIASCVRRGLALVADPHRPLLTHHLVVHAPSQADWAIAALHPLSVSVVSLVCHAEADFAASGVPGFRRKTVIRHLAVNAMLARKAGPGRAEALWLPPVSADLATAHLTADRAPEATPGVLWYAARPDPSLNAALQAAMGARKLRQFCLGTEAGAPVAVDVPELNRFGPPSLDRCLAGLDLLILAPDLADADLPDTLVAAFLAAGRRVVAPRRLMEHYGAGPVYATAGTLATVAARALKGLPRQADAPAGERPAGEDFAARCRSATALRLRDAGPRRRSPTPFEDRPVLFLPSNGVGVGHLTRLLAVARRMPAGRAVFASHAAAIEVIHQFGFAAEYLPSSALVGGDFDAWDAWFRHDLGLILDRHDPRLVVYDGNNPSPGLIAAVASRRDCRLAWMRRGMWAATTTPHLDNARWCDLILEPGELAAAVDSGVTTRRKHEVTALDPVRLLDESELLARREAAAALGLDPARPAVLVQLGSGYNRDLLSMLDQIMATLGRFPGLQIAIAEWVTGSLPLTLWPQATILRGFPISQYVRAFDFAISAAGYNSFHELLGFGVPSIFIANRHPTMDDQAGRAHFAQGASAAFEIGEDELADLHDVVAMLMQQPARDYLAQNCRALARANGAVQAARHLNALVATRAGA